MLARFKKASDDVAWEEASFLRCWRGWGGEQWPHPVLPAAGKVGQGPVSNTSERTRHDPASPASGWALPALYFPAALGNAKGTKFPGQPGRRSSASFVRRLRPYLHAHFLMADGGQGHWTYKYLFNNRHESEMEVSRVYQSCQSINENYRARTRRGTRTEGGKMTVETRPRGTDRTDWPRSRGHAAQTSPPPP